MSTETFTPPPPTTQGSNLSPSDHQWLLIAQNLSPLYEVDTSAGSYAETPPAAGVSTSGQTGQCKEITYVKTSSDGHTYTLNGVQGGPYTLTAQWQFLKIKSDGTSWYLDGQTPPGSGPPSGPAGGDLSGTYPNPTVAKVNGGAIPLSKTIVGTNGSGEIVDATAATLTNNTSGTAANLSGTPTVPNGTKATTQAPGDNSTKLATTAYTDAAVAVETTRAEAAEALLAPKASPALTGTPTAPTAAALTDNTQIATTAYTDSAVAVETARAEAAEALKAPLASPAFTGTPTAPTKAPLTNNTDLATTAYTDLAVGVETTRAEAAEATKQNTLTGTGLARNTGACTELSGDVTTSGSNAATVVKINGAAVPLSKTIVGSNGSGQLVDATGATLSNNTSGTAANLSGTPALPNGTTASTQSAGDNSTNLATTAYADALVAATGAPAICLPFASFVPSAAETVTVFGAANTQQEVMFVMTETITIGHVTVNIGTGVAAALMGVAIYDAAGTTELAKADAFSVDTGHTGAQRIAFSASVTLFRGKAYWLAWTATTATTLTCTNFLMSTQWQAVYNAGAVRSGTSGTATSGGKCNSTIGAISSAQLRIPLFIFD